MNNKLIFMVFLSIILGMLFFKGLYGCNNLIEGQCPADFSGYHEQLDHLSRPRDRDWTCRWNTGGNADKQTPYYPNEGDGRHSCSSIYNNTIIHNHSSLSYLSHPLNQWCRDNPTSPCCVWHDCRGRKVTHTSGNAVADECGICNGNGISQGHCDCWGRELDECGVCGGDNECLDECGVPHGSGIPAEHCDCDGNVLDECGMCGGTGIPAEHCNCDGDVLDECGVCDGDNACLGCDEVPNSGQVLDECGVCGGDNLCKRYILDGSCIVDTRM